MCPSPRCWARAYRRACWCPRCPRHTPRQPAGIAGIPPQWLPRRWFAGTFDATWRAEKAPYWPDDYDARHACAAPPDQQIDPPLVGGELVRLRHLMPGDPNFSFRAPTALSRSRRRVFPIGRSRSRMRVFPIRRPRSRRRVFLKGGRGVECECFSTHEPSIGRGKDLARVGPVAMLDIKRWARRNRRRGHAKTSDGDVLPGRRRSRSGWQRDAGRHGLGSSASSRDRGAGGVRGRVGRGGAAGATSRTSRGRGSKRARPCTSR